MNDIRMEAAIIFDSYLPEALRQARLYAGDDGFVASLPALLHARANADYDNIVWNTWFTSNSEESVVTTPRGNHVVVTVHGGGIFGTPERFEKLYRADQNRSNTEGFTGQYAAKISEQEARGVLEGARGGEPYAIVREPEAPGLPRSLEITAEGRSLGLQLKRLRPLTTPAEELGNGRPPEGMETLPLERLEPIRHADAGHEAGS